MSLIIRKEIQQTKKLKWLFIFFLLFSFMIVSVSETLAASNPVLFFSDLESGPKTGWEGSATKGAAVTIWGKNFYPTRGSSYITVNGAQITDYAEWGVIGPARGLERITFWLKSTCQDGAGTITVTVNGITSNTLPFTVRTGNIYFIAKTGTDGNNGKYATSQGGTNGPWLSFKKSNGDLNSIIQAGDIVYIRSGNYTDLDAQGANLYMRDFTGTNGNPFAWVGYPGEWPVIGAGGSQIDAFSLHPNEGAVNAPIGYYVVSKLIFENSGTVWSHHGVHDVRLVGCIARNSLGYVASGIIAWTQWNIKVYGWLFKDSGYDNWKHAIYPSADKSDYWGRDASNWDIGWNEFDNWISNNATIRTPYGAGIVNLRGIGTYNVTDVYVHDNYFHDSPDSMALVIESGPSPVYFYNNVLYNIAKRGSGTMYGAIRPMDGILYLYNNTFYDVGSSTGKVDDTNWPISVLWLRGDQAAQTIVYSTNNIFYMTATNEQHNMYVGDFQEGHFYSNSDIYYGGGALPTGNANQYVITNPIKDKNPQFVSITNHDFHLQSSSPAINSGATPPGTISLNFDYDMAPRPMDGKYDIGAYEYTGTYTPPPSSTEDPSLPIDNIAPSPPLSLRIVQ